MADTVDGVLDDGAAKGLGFFTDLTPRYLRAFPAAETMTLSSIYAAYDAERGLNLQTLAATAAGLQMALTTAKSQSDKQRQVSQVLPVSWQGEAGTRGIQVVASLASHSETDCTAVQKVLDALNTASTTILQTVKDKVKAIDELLVDGKVTVANLTPTDIDQVITGKETGEIEKEVWEKMIPGAIFPKKYPEQIKTECERWLNQTFVFKYEQSVTAFNSACSIARTAIEGKYDLIVTALNAVEEKSYDGAKSVAATTTEEQKTPPAGTQVKANGDQTTAAGTQTTTNGNQSTSAGNQTTAAGTQTSNGDTSTTTGSTTKTTTGAKTTDDSSTTTDEDSDTSDALSTLTSTISELGTTLSEALTGDLGDTLTSAVESVGTSISDGIEQLTEQASSLLSGETEASFQLGDTEVSIEASENGLSLTTTDANGGSTQYTLTLDENGIPVLTQDSTSVDGATTGQADDTTGVLGSGTPQSGSGQGEAGLAEAGTGGRGGADATTSETPDLTNAPVTSEIGSGEQSSGSVAGGVPVGPRSTKQETDGEHVPSVEDHPVSDPGDSGAVLAEAGPL